MLACLQVAVRWREARVEREHLDELHYIVPIANVRSVASFGILSHRRADELRHESVADPSVQELRAQKRLPSGRMLHDYANLYINARNAVLYRRCKEGRMRDLCVLQVSPRALDVIGTYVANENAASDRVVFASAPRGLEIVDERATFVRAWRDDGSSAAETVWSRTMAEVLVPDRLPAGLIVGAYVGTRAVGRRVSGQWPSLAVSVSPDMFFGFTGADV